MTGNDRGGGGGSGGGVGGGFWKVDYSCQALRSARREFKSC